MILVQFFSRFGLSISLLICLFFALSSCGEDRTDIRDYYFPLRQLDDGLVYEYGVVGQDSMVPDYWYYRSEVSDTSLHLISVLYDENFYQSQLSVQEMVSNGMMAISLKLFTPDTLGTQNSHDANILSPAVFPFQVVQDKGLFLYKVRYQLPGENGSTTLILNRQYAGETSYTYNGKDYPAVRFRLKGLAEIEDASGGGIEPSFSGEEVYVKGMGLVYYSRIFGADTLAYALREQYGMEQLEERFLDQE